MNRIHLELFAADFLGFLEAAVRTTFRSQPFRPLDATVLYCPESLLPQKYLFMEWCLSEVGQHILQVSRTIPRLQRGAKIGAVVHRLASELPARLLVPS